MLNFAKQIGPAMDFDELSANSATSQSDAAAGDSAAWEFDEQRREQIFRQRAEKLSARQTVRDDSAARVPVLVVALKTEKYGIELEHVKHVFRSIACTVVPGARQELLGVADLSGDICSILDLASLLNVGSREAGAQGPVVQVKLKELLVGLRVDDVCEVQQVAFDALVNFDEHGETPATQYVTGINPEGVAVLSMEALSAHKVFLTT